MLGGLDLLYSNEDNHCHKCFTDFRFGKKMNIMMSFNPHELECFCCSGKVLVDHKAVVKTDWHVFILSDQCFLASASANGNGQGLKINGVENGSLWEIFTVFYNTVRRKKLHVPAGSFVFLGFASHLADFGVVVCADELGAVAQRILSLYGGCIYFSPCPMLLNDGSTSNMLMSSIAEPEPVGASTFLVGAGAGVKM